MSKRQSRKAKTIRDKTSLVLSSGNRYFLIEIRRVIGWAWSIEINVFEVKFFVNLKSNYSLFLRASHIFPKGSFLKQTPNIKN